MYAFDNCTLKHYRTYIYLTTHNLNATLITLPKHLSGFHKLYTSVHATLKPAISTFYSLCKHTEVALCQTSITHFIHPQIVRYE